MSGKAAILICALSFAAMGSTVPAGMPDTSLYELVLQRYVDARGRVDYLGISENPGPLERFVGQIAEVSPDSHPELFTDERSRLAYWINTYNSLVLRAFASDYPEKRGRLGGLIGRGLFFYKRKFTVGGRKLSLAHIENSIIRKRFAEPRIHFALVCASESCPRLARRAYTQGNVEQMLEDETRRFLNEARNVEIDEYARSVRLSKLFDWYGRDFGTTEAERLAFVARYRNDGEKLLRGKWKIRYFGYDWSPNDLPASTH